MEIIIKFVFYSLGSLCILSALIMIVIVPFLSEYKNRKAEGKLDPDKSWFENFFNPPIKR